MKKIIEEINRLSRKVQSNDRVYYYGRIIEFLSDILLLDLSQTSIDRFIKWLDSSDVIYYTNLFNNLEVVS